MSQGVCRMRIKLLIMVLISLVFLGCSPVSKGDYVTYTSNDYIFLYNGFLTQSIDCVELGRMKEGELLVKYCVGENYASRLVQGFIFEHEYTNNSERFIGASLQFKAKNSIKFDCSSETIEGASSGTEYINCMIPTAGFDLYSFIINSDEDIQGVFNGTLDRQNVFRGVINTEGKALLKEFYQERAKSSRKEWKQRSL